MSPTSGMRGSARPNPAGSAQALATSGAAAWLAAARRESSTERWLLEVPDIGVTCEVLLADRLLRDLDQGERRRLHGWVRARQHASGAWLDLFGKPDLSLTAMGYWACVECGDDPRAENLVRARRIVHEFGGAQRANFTVRLWLALAGHIPWSWLPSMPAELWLLPPWTPVSPSRISPWARGLMTPLLLLTHAKARLQVSSAEALLVTGKNGRPIPPRLLHPGIVGDLFQAFDSAVKVAKKIPRGPVRRVALARARAWISQTQQHHGGWFSARPTLLSLLALRSMGAPYDDRRIVRGLRYLRAARGLARVPAGPHAGEVHLVQGLTSPPVAAVAGLVGQAGEDEAHRWLLSGELRQAGEWQRRTDAPAGGWSHEFAAQHVLDIKATCSVLDTLGALPQGSRFAPEAWAATRRACEIMLAMQEPDGSFARFERGESDVWMSRLPWRDASILAAGPRFSREQIQVTARVLHRLAELGWKPDDDRIARGLRWLERRCEDEVGELDLVTLADLARCFGALQPREHGLRRGLEETVRGRQREDGSFGALCHTAVGLRALMDAQGGLCIQSERAARQLAGALAARSAAAEDGAPPFVDHARVPGLGLCSHCEDPALGVREAGAALRSFAERGGARLRIET